MLWACCIIKCVVAQLVQHRYPYIRINSSGGSSTSYREKANQPALAKNSAARMTYYGIRYMASRSGTKCIGAGTHITAIESLLPRDLAQYPTQVN